MRGRPRPGLACPRAGAFRNLVCLRRTLSYQRAAPTLTDVLAAKLDAWMLRACSRGLVVLTGADASLGPTPSMVRPYPTAVPERARLRRGSAVATRRGRGAALE